MISTSQLLSFFLSYCYICFLSNKILLIDEKWKWKFLFKLFVCLNID